jgi:hypothetical protein
LCWPGLKARGTLIPFPPCPHHQPPRTIPSATATAALAFRQFYLNKSNDAAPGAATGATGSLSFIDSELSWSAVPSKPAGPPVGAIVGPIVAVLAALIGFVGFKWLRR